MKRNPIVLSIAIIIALSGFCITNMANAQPPEGFEGPPPIDHFGNTPKNYEKLLPSKAEMEAKRIEIDKRLNFSEKQKQQLAEQRKVSVAQIKPILDKMNAKKQEYNSVMGDKTLSKEAKDKKLNDIKASLKSLNIQAEAIRQKDLAHFENILTEPQKKEFAKIKEEQKRDMARRRNAIGQ